MKYKKLTYNGIFDVSKPYTATAKLSKLTNQISNTKIPTLSDAEGLKRAYQLPNKVYVDNNTNNMYIAGTSNLQDAWDDLKMPFHLTSHSQRYAQAEQALKENPDVNEVIGHSLGAATALELNKNNNYKFKTRTYGSPTFSNEEGERYRHPGDFISIFDRGAKMVPIFDWLNPLRAHTYERYDEQGADDISNYGNSFSYSKKKF